MKLWLTEISAYDPATGQMKEWGGPNVPGINLVDAKRYCQMNGLGYCKVLGELIEEIPVHKDTWEPDWGNKIDYDNIGLY